MERILRRMMDFLGHVVVKVDVRVLALSGSRQG